MGTKPRAATGKYSSEANSWVGANNRLDAVARRSGRALTPHVTLVDPRRRFGFIRGTAIIPDRMFILAAHYVECRG